MTPIQQLMLGVGASKKTYMDDVFSTYLYDGTSVSNSGPAQTINNGIDVSGKGGLVWIKTRNGSLSHALFDTVRGKTNRIKTNSSDGEDTSTSYLADFKTNGFEVGTSASTNSNDVNFASWTFRKTPGFFDVVTWTGNSDCGGSGTAAQTISHSLGCVPGMIMVKRTDDAENWIVYHRGVNGGVNPEDYAIFLNLNNAQTDSNLYWNDTAPTSSSFTAGHQVNICNATYVAYVFAGGESNASEARSVDFDGSGDYLSLANNSDLSAGTGDFTFECWVKPDSWSGSPRLISVTDNVGMRIGIWNNNMALLTNSGIQNYYPTLPSLGQWTHLAVTRSGTTARLFYNGLEIPPSSFSSSTNSTDYSATGSTLIGTNNTDDGSNFDGSISNLRFVKGTAVYTSSFRPPTEPLTNITNTKLLCCNNSSVTGKTVGGTITANGNPTASTDSPFDDPAAFKFGESGSESVIKCGSYIGNGSTTGPEINLGFEPQWILIKDTSANVNWRLHDSMRGITTGGTDPELSPNMNSDESNSDRLELTSTGFKITTDSGSHNDSGDTYIYIAIRRSDGYVGKPPDAGTDVFNMVMGTSNSDVPAYVSGFVTDFAFNRVPGNSENWWTQGRLIGTKYLIANSTAAEASAGDNKWDYNNGWYAATNNQSAYQSWMWKRHAGFDVVTYKGNGTAGHQIPHSLSKTPEMIWIKKRNAVGEWTVGHAGVNGGVNPWEYELLLEENYAQSDTSGKFNDTAPSSTHFTIGNSTWVNSSSGTYIAMLFASVDGVSKVGYYTGNGNSSTQTITTGFQPRFLIVKRVDSTSDWYVVDTTRGWDSGINDQVLNLESSGAQYGLEVGAPTSTGFTVTGNGTNVSSAKYVYYAHA